MSVDFNHFTETTKAGKSTAWLNSYLTRREARIPFVHATNFTSFEESELELDKKDNYSRESVQCQNQKEDICTIEPLLGNAEH